MVRGATAARRGRPLRHPTHLHVLVRINLVHTKYGKVLVRVDILQLGPFHVRLLPPDLRREHPTLPSVARKGV